ncbi:MAG: hypothetical protein ACTSP4_09045 [Candidatus Hodarchaeales archaeon]
MVESSESESNTTGVEFAEISIKVSIPIPLLEIINGISTLSNVNIKNRFSEYLIAGMEGDCEDFMTMSIGRHFKQCSVVIKDLINSEF